jgi:hypothetical protein
MKSLITVEDGRMFEVDTHAFVLTLKDKLGKPVNSRPLQAVPSVIPGSPFIFASRDGVEVREEKIVHVIYFR